MKNTPAISIAFAALGGFLGAAFMMAVLAVANGGHGFVSCTGTHEFGWLVPLIGGLVIGTVSLLLLSSGTDKRNPSGPGFHSSACIACGKPILDEWRLCPHCGQLLECRTEVPSALRVEPGL